MMYRLGYCTNVHAGATWQETRHNLEQYSVRVRQLLDPSSTLGVGLWLASQAADELWHSGQIDALRDWLREARLCPYTLNGFPYGNFHEPSVKHKVYLPTWRQQARRAYTERLAQILSRLLEPGQEGSISTLPIQWGTPSPTPEELAAAADNLISLAERLEAIDEASGRLIYVCLEPEPGCVIQRSGDVVRFFEDYLLPRGNAQRIRRYLRVCHDVCHAAVMFERQEDVLRAYHEAGIQVGKMQISSAIVVPLEELAPADRRAALDQVARFAEDRYLHQTMVRWPDQRWEFHQDLPELLDRPASDLETSLEWRIHYHVPVYLSAFGLLRTSQHDIPRAMEAARRWQPELQHLEVETYAWSVLPPELQQGDLAEGIAEEIRWFGAQLDEDRSPSCPNEA